MPLAVVLVGVLTAGGYDELQKGLRFVLLCLLAYVASAILAHPDWHRVLQDALVPHFRFDPPWTEAALALIGTTLTPTTSMSGRRSRSRRRRHRSSSCAPGRRAGATVGIFFGVLIMWFVVISMAATLGVHHQEIDSAQQAAQALRPLAGPAAGYLYGIALLASAVVALPVLMATCAYVVAAEFDWERGLPKRVRGAARFYAVLTGSIAVVTLVVGAANLAFIVLHL